jgi:hypothetical protein
MMWDRHVTGSPLYSLNVTAAERAIMRGRLVANVRRHGIAGLVVDGAITRDLLCFASLWVADDADRLQWIPLLQELEVQDSELQEYPSLYGPIESGFRSLGRRVVTTPHGRRFLASFLRDGGLPANIGNLAELIVGAAEDVGWSALRHEHVRTLVTTAVAGRATGPAATLLAGAEGRSALDDLLATAAEARARLVEGGVDPVSLHTHDDVRSALDRTGVPLPAVRNAELLVAVLRSFTQEPPTPRSVLAPLRLVARSRDGALELRLHLDLCVLADADIPSSVTHLTMKAEPCPPTRSRLQVRREAGGFTTDSGDASLEWPRIGAPAPSRVEALYLGAGGVRQVVPIATVGWEYSDELWFDRNGELLTETRVSVQPGEVFVIVSWRDAELSGEDGVHVETLRPPAGVRRAWRVEASGAGALRLSAAGKTEEMRCSPTAVAVSVLQSVGVPGLPRRFARALPDIALPVGVVASVAVARMDRSGSPVRLSHVAGLVRLSSHPAVRALTGRISARVTTDDGRSWAAWWHVLPPRFAMRQSPGCVDLENAGRLDHVVGGEAVVTKAGVRIQADDGETAVLAFFDVDDSEPLRLPLDVGPRALKLWTDRALTQGVAIEPRPELTELMINEGACLEVGGPAGGQLNIRNGVGDELVVMTKPSSQRVFLQLSELLTSLWRRAEAKGRFTATLDPSGESLEFDIHVPRLAAPKVHPEPDGALLVEFPLDKRDLPVCPGLTFFPITPPFASPAVVAVDLVERDGRYNAQLTWAVAPSQRGMYVAFLVDRAVDPPRPMSNGKRFSVPLSLGTPPAPEGLSPLERALWQHDDDALDEALTRLPESATFDAYADAFIHATRVRAAYRLETFWLWFFVGTRAPWLILTCGARLAAVEQAPWFGIWARQIADFSWLRVTQRDVRLLAATLPRRPIEERVALLSRAQAAQPMLKSTEHQLFSGVAKGQSLLTLNAVKNAEINAPKVADIVTHPALFALPTAGAGLSWLRGADLDVDMHTQVEATLSGQILNGARARAIRNLFQRKVPPGGHIELKLPAGDAWAAKVCDQIQREWAPSATNVMGYRLRDLDRECALAAMALVPHRMNRRRLGSSEMKQVLKLEQTAPDLLDAWITVVSLQQEKRS